MGARSQNRQSVVLALVLALAMALGGCTFVAAKTKRGTCKAGPVIADIGIMVLLAGLGLVVLEDSPGLGFGLVFTGLAWGSAPTIECKRSP